MTTTTIALGERAMLVNLSVSIWSARKHDIRISDKVAADHGADRSMGRYAKHLIPRALLTAVNAANSALRDHHNLNTLAWGDDGTRILPAASYLGYQEQQQGLEESFGWAVRAFVACYPQYVETARKALNGLFDPKDHPAPARIGEKFGVRRHFMPVAQPDDFRVRLGDTQVARIRAEIEARNAELVESVKALPNGNAWLASVERVGADVRHLSVHRGHTLDVSNGHDALVDVSNARQMTFTGTREALRERLAQLEARGATGVIFGTSGYDVERELRAYAEVAGLR